MMAFKLLRKKLNSCIGNYTYEQVTVRFLFTIFNWPLVLMSLSYHENRKQPKPSRNASLWLYGFENLDYVLNKAAEISIRVLCFFFVISTGFFHREQFYFLCRFRYLRWPTSATAKLTFPRQNLLFQGKTYFTWESKWVTGLHRLLVRFSRSPFG